MKIRDIRNKLLTGEYNLYMDVSGSTAHLNTYIDKIFKSKEALPKHLYVFSTIVDKVKVSDFIKGVYTTTGGTDINPVLEHLKHSRLKKAIVLTDGCFHCPVRPKTEKKQVELIVPKELFNTADIEYLRKVKATYAHWIGKIYILS